MFKVKKSPLFLQQVQYHAQEYKNRVGVNVAKRFTTAVKEALHFIRQSPYACTLYDAGEGYEDLLAHHFRKWNLNGFPYVILFRLGDNSTIFIELLYAQRMDVPSRLAIDIDTVQ